MIRAEVYLTNVVKVRPGENNNIITPYFIGKNFTAIGQTWVDRLREELSELPANVFVPMGNTALFGLSAGKNTHEIGVRIRDDTFCFVGDQSRIELL